jgi:hypothetical protein
VVEIAMAAAHDTDSVVGGGCDDQFEFEFALDIMLDGIERPPDQFRTTSTGHTRLVTTRPSRHTQPGRRSPPARNCSP